MHKSINVSIVYRNDTATRYDMMFTLIMCSYMEITNTIFIYLPEIICWVYIHIYIQYTYIMIIMNTVTHTENDAMMR